jgi:hypothetical protein
MFGIRVRSRGAWIVRADFEGIQQLKPVSPDLDHLSFYLRRVEARKYTFLANAGPYSHTDNPLAMLADRIEGLIAQEHAKWTSTQEHVQEQKRASATR